MRQLDPESVGRGDAGASPLSPVRPMLRFADPAPAAQMEKESEAAAAALEGKQAAVRAGGAEAKEVQRLLADTRKRISGIRKRYANDMSQAP